MKKPAVIKIFVVIVSCSLLLTICYQILVILQLRFITTLGWEKGHYLWMAGGGGVVRWDVDQQAVVERTFFRPDGIKQFFISKKGQVWGYGNGIWLFESGKWIETSEITERQHQPVYDMAETKEGIIWIATWEGFKTWNKETRLWEPSQINESGVTLVQSTDGSIWFGLTNNGVIRLKSGQLTHWTTANGLIDNEIRSMLAASDGTIWVGTSHGISHWDGNTWQGWERLGYPYDPNGLGVFKILETRDGTVWIATTEDFARWKFGQWTTYQGSPRCFTNFALLEVDDGSVWAGCSTGLYRWTGSRWHEYGATEGITDNSMAHLIQGSNGILYAKTNSGVYRYISEQDHWQSFPTNSFNLWQIASGW